MKLHHLGKWFKIYHEDGTIKHTQTEPKSMEGINRVKCLNDGKLHNEDGPAEVFYHADGSIKGEDYYLNHHHLTKDEWERQVANL